MGTGLGKENSTDPPPMEDDKGFDWEKSTEEFDKEKIMRDIEEHQNKTDPSKPINPLSNSPFFDSISNELREVLQNEVEPQKAYNPNNSFFDTLSCDTFEFLRSDPTKVTRENLEEQRMLDEVTFGPIGSSRQPTSLLDSLRNDELTHILYLVCTTNIQQIKVLSLVCKIFWFIFRGDLFWQKMTSFYWGDVPKTGQTWKQAFQYIMKESPYRPCAICNSYPIHGIRYQCLNCVDTNLCEECESKGIHPISHLVMKTFHPDKKIECRLSCDVEMVCMQCGKKAPKMYTTSKNTSPNATLCIDCSKIFKNDNPNDRLWEINTALEPSQVSTNHLGTNRRGAWCDVRLPGCISNCTFINWKCVRCYGYDICTNCDAKIRENLNIVPTGSRNHSSECGVLKLYHLSLSYDHWNINGSVLDY